jgi:Sulfotransferase family
VIYLFTVVAPPRSGTKWFAELFTTERSYCYHELTTLLQPYPANRALIEAVSAQIVGHDFEQAQRRLLLQAFPQYFARLWERAAFGQHVVGNSDASIVRLLPALWLLWPDMRFLFSFRNGINQVNSMLVWEQRLPSSDRRVLEHRHASRDYFEILCRQWTKNVEGLRRHREWLESRGARCVETRLEAVTSDEFELHRVWDAIVGHWDDFAARNRRLMATTVNARVNVERVVPAEESWAAWTPEQRRLFGDICGDTQRELGYELPPVDAALERRSAAVPTGAAASS